MSYAKYGSQRVSHAGYSFASKLESSVFDILKLMERAGDIVLIQCQKHILLSKAEIKYIADFYIMDHKKKEYAYVEAKGMMTPEWKLKLKLFKTYGDKPLWLFEGHWRNPKLTSTIYPAGET